MRNKILFWYLCVPISIAAYTMDLQKPQEASNRVFSKTGQIIKLSYSPKGNTVYKSHEVLKKQFGPLHVQGIFARFGADQEHNDPTLAPLLAKLAYLAREGFKITVKNLVSETINFTPERVLDIVAQAIKVAQSEVKNQVDLAIAQRNSLNNKNIGVEIALLVHIADSDKIIIANLGNITIMRHRNGILKTLMKKQSISPPVHEDVTPIAYYYKFKPRIKSSSVVPGDVFILETQTVFSALDTPEKVELIEAQKQFWQEQSNSTEHKETHTSFFAPREVSLLTRFVDSFLLFANTAPSNPFASLLANEPDMIPQELIERINETTQFRHEILALHTKIRAHVDQKDTLIRAYENIYARTVPDEIKSLLGTANIKRFLNTNYPHIPLENNILREQLLDLDEKIKNTPKNRNLLIVNFETAQNWKIPVELQELLGETDLVQEYIDAHLPRVIIPTFQELKNYYRLGQLESAGISLNQTIKANAQSDQTVLIGVVCENK